MTASRMSSFRQIFRLFFVACSLYLLGDVFYRWDGFSYYGSFADFLPAVALVTCLFTGIAFFISMFSWIMVSVSKWFLFYIGWKIKEEHAPIFILSLFVIVSLTLTFFPSRINSISGFSTKLALLFSMIVISLFIAWIFRNKSHVIQEKITPLVWLFGIFFVFSLVLTAYHTWYKPADKAAAVNTYSKSVADSKRPNILLVTFDALRAQSMSVYGYQRETTPFISKWAEQATVFKKAEAESNYTSPTTTSLMLGQRLWTHQNYYSHGYLSGRGRENIPAVLKENGYYTMMFSANKIVSAKSLGISDYFEFAPGISVFYSGRTLFGALDRELCNIFCDKIKLHDWILKKDFIVYKFIIRFSNDNSNTLFPPELAFNTFLRNINNNPHEPYFAWIHLYPPHDPYLAPEPFKGMFNSSPELRTLNSQSVATNFPQNTPFTNAIKQSVPILKDRYEEFIRYCDKQFEDFIGQLIKKNELANTVVILSADHGESFEHDYLTHGSDHLYEQVTHVPLIIKDINQTEGRIVEEQVEQIDISATILDLANVPLPSWMEGRSLRPLMRGEKLPFRPSFSMALDWNRSADNPITRGTFATWENGYKLIHYYNYHDNKTLLFDLKKDPDELNNIFDEEPEVGRRLLGLVMDHLERANKKIMEKQ